MPLWNSFPYTDYHQMNLQYIMEKVKLIDPTNEAVNQLVNQYNDIANKVTILDQQYDGFADQIQQQFNDLTQQIYTDVGNFLIAEIQTIQGALNDMSDALDAALTNQDARIDVISEKVNQINTELIQAMYVDSPFTGEQITVQQAIYELASLHMTDALTAAEYDAADLTASAYDALDLTAYAYDWNGKTYIS